MIFHNLFTTSFGRLYLYICWCSNMKLTRCSFRPYFIKSVTGFQIIDCHPFTRKWSLKHIWYMAVYFYAFSFLLSPVIKYKVLPLGVENVWRMNWSWHTVLRIEDRESGMSIYEILENLEISCLLTFVRWIEVFNFLCGREGLQRKGRVKRSHR